MSPNKLQLKTPTENAIFLEGLTNQ